jgi:hypothetical protein
MLCPPAPTPPSKALAHPNLNHPLPLHPNPPHPARTAPTPPTKPPSGSYKSPGEAYVEGDASSASYFLAGATITGGTVTVEGCGSESLQGDVRFAGEQAAGAGEWGAAVDGRGRPCRAACARACWLGRALGWFVVIEVPAALQKEPT